MTNPKWLIAIATLFVALTLVCGILEGSYLGAGHTSLLAEFIRPPILNPTAMMGWFGNLWNMLWFDYSMFHGGWAIFKYIFFWPISIGLVVSYGALLVQAAIVAIGSFARIFKPL